MSIAEKLRKLLNIKAAIKEALFLVGQEVADKMEDWAMAIRNICNVPFENLGYSEDGARAYNKMIRKAYNNGIRIKRLKEEKPNYTIIECLNELKIYSQNYEYPGEPYCLPDMWNSYRYMPGIIGNRTCFSFPTEINETIGVNRNYLLGCTGLRSIKIIGPVDNYSSLCNDCPFLECIEFDASQATQGGIICSSSLGQQASLIVLKVKGIGTIDTCTELGIRTQHCIGINTDDYPNARQDLVDSLLTNSFDRANSGYSVFTITLSLETFNLLTEEEITAITNKGYTITVG
jgi:hypothetical protein